MKIGINITAFNRKQFTEQCFTSFLWSNAEDIEYCFIDNGSTDGTKDLLMEFQSKYENVKHIVFNKDNLYIGGAIRQGWHLLSENCPLLGCINNDFLVEPGWDKNVRACFDELKLDYIVGTVRPDLASVKVNTPSGKGHYVLPQDCGAGTFIKREHFLKGFYPDTKPFSKGHVGPGPAWHKKLRKNLKGFRLASPGVIVRNSEYLKPEYVEYYNTTFKIRGRENQLAKFRGLDRAGKPRGWMNWKTFLETYYPEKLN